LIAGRLVLASLFLFAACERPSPVAGRVVLAWEAFPLSFDPRIGQDQASQRLLSFTHQGLIRRNEKLEWVPDGCLDWRWERPFTVLSFDFPNLEEARRLGPSWFRFPDGRPLGAADALDAIQALRDPSLSSPKAGPFKAEIENLEIVPAGTLNRLRITLRAPNPGFPPNLGRAVLGIAPAGTRGPRLPGTGPYRLSEVVAEQRIVLDPVAGHPDLTAHPGVPQKIEIRLLPDATTRLLSLRHGSVQATLNNLPTDLLANTRPAQVHRFPGSNLEYIAFQCGHPVLGKPEVRKALALAIDRESLVRGLMGGMAREAWGFFPPDLPHGLDARAGLGIPSELKARRRLAEQLLDVAGHPRGPGGTRFSLRMSATPEVSSRMKAIALQAQWREIGVDLQILTREFGTLLTEVMGGKFEVVSLRWVGVTDPEMLYETFHSSRIPPKGFNRGRFSDPECDRLLEEARACGDPGQRLARLRQAQQRIVDLAPYAFLWWPDQFAVLAPGLEVDLNGAGDYRAIWRMDAPR
jgi:peptide/nickel transport system substrate-binding protein